MIVADLNKLYRDAISVHLRSMGISEQIADFEANRILKRWMKFE